MGSDYSSIHRRRFLRLGAGAGAAAVGVSLLNRPTLAADDFPIKPINIVNVYSQGGSYDAILRAVGPALLKELGQPITQSFVPGANGILGMTRAISARHDGYTLAINSITNFVISTYFEKPKEYTDASFDYLGSVIDEPVAILVRRDSRFKTLDEFLKAGVSSEPPSIGVTQPKGLYRLVAAILQDVSGAKFRVVNYPGGGPSRKALISGEVDAVVTGLFSAGSIFNDTRGLVILADKNPIPAEMPMPTAAEVLGAGKMPDVVQPAVIMIPADVEAKYPGRRKKITDALTAAVRAPETVKLAQNFGIPEAALGQWSSDRCDAYAKTFLEITKKYERLL